MQGGLCISASAVLCLCSPSHARTAFLVDRFLKLHYSAIISCGANMIPTPASFRPIAAQQQRPTALAAGCCSFERDKLHGFEMILIAHRALQNISNAVLHEFDWLVNRAQDS